MAQHVKEQSRLSVAQTTVLALPPPSKPKVSSTLFFIPITFELFPSHERHAYM